MSRVVYEKEIALFNMFIIADANTPFWNSYKHSEQPLSLSGIDSKPLVITVMESCLYGLG